MNINTLKASRECQDWSVICSSSKAKKLFFIAKEHTGMLLRTLCLSPHLVEKIHTCRHYACYGNKEYLSQAIRDVPATWLPSWREPGPNPRTWLDGTLHVCEPLSMLAFPVTVCKKKSNKSYAWTLLNVIPPPTLLTSRSLYSRMSCLVRGFSSEQTFLLKKLSSPMSMIGFPDIYVTWTDLGSWFVLSYYS